MNVRVWYHTDNETLSGGTAEGVKSIEAVADAIQEMISGPVSKNGTIQIGNDSGNWTILPARELKKVTFEVLPR